MFLYLNDFEMKKLNRKKDLIVYLPDDYYESDDQYPVLYIQDGQNAFFDEKAYSGVSWGFDQAVKERSLKIIMVAIPCENSAEGRIKEYGPWKISKELSYLEIKKEGIILGGEGKEYVDWMIDELKVYMDSHFRTIKWDTAIIGSSMGAVIAAYATFARPEVFRKCAALSTAFWFYMEEWPKLLQKTNFADIWKFYFDLGEFEGCGSALIDRMYIDTNKQMYEWIGHKIPSLKMKYYEGVSHNESEWRKRLPSVLKYLYGGK